MNKVLFSSNRMDWETPQDLFDKLDKEFHFDLDPCANDDNHKCQTYFTPDQDGLQQDWGECTVFCNPPYGREIGKWVEKCATHDGIAVMLIPARTDTRWFHKWIYNRNNAEIRFIPGRLKFGGALNAAPFPSMIVVFSNRTEFKFEPVNIHFPNTECLSGSMTITKDDPKYKRFEQAFESESHLIERISQKINLLNEMIKHEWGEDGNKDG